MTTVANRARPDTDSLPNSWEESLKPRYSTEERYCRRCQPRSLGEGSAGIHVSDNGELVFPALIEMRALLNYKDLKMDHQVLVEAFKNHDKETLRTAWLVAINAHRIMEKREKYLPNRWIIVLDFSGRDCEVTKILDDLSRTSDNETCAICQSPLLKQARGDHEYSPLCILNIPGCTHV